MKIPASVRSLYEKYKTKYEPLRVDVDQLMKGQKKSSWHYESRIKSIESFALKLESGRWRRFADIDDLFAAVLVVQNMSGLQDAERLITRKFNVVRRRPKSRQSTTTRADEFPFDDIRLYVCWSTTALVPRPQYNGLIFELQLRTFLQHAWNIATHDVVYKTEKLKWSKERLAAQVRASLEQAEVTLHEIDKLAGSPVLRRSDSRTRQVNRVNNLLAKVWEPQRLPTDIKRMSTNVLILIESLGISVRRLGDLLAEERDAGRGALTQNLSPFGTIMQSLIRREPERMRRLLCSTSRDFAIWLPSEIDLSERMDESEFRDVVVLS